MSQIGSVAVFCGSSLGADPAYREAAEALGRGLAASGITLVYGGGRIGLMGVLADAALAGGGRVIGVIPDFLVSREVGHGGLSSLLVTDGLQARKQRMAELADAFVSMPGGLGTFDETIEVLTWRQLGLHEKPVLVCDVAGSGRALAALVEDAVARGFASPEAAVRLEVLDGVPATLGRLGAIG